MDHCNNIPTILYDNRKRQDRTHKNKRLDMVQGFVIQHRIPSLHLSSEVPPAEDILNIPLKKILPSKDDVRDLETEFRVAVEEVACELFDFLPEFKEPPAGPHEEESKQKSLIVGKQCSCNNKIA